MEKKKIPKKILTDILIKSNHNCCICRSRYIMPVIHHIDQNPSNNDPDNLIPLCPNCHSTVHLDGCTGRGYSKEELKQCRKICFKTVEKQRKEATRRSSNSNRDLLLSVFAQFEVRKILYRIEQSRFNWNEIIHLLQSLIPYGQEFDYYVRSELLSAVSLVASDTRNNMPKEVVSTMVNVIIQILPIYSIVSPSKRRITKKNSDLILRAVEIAHDILWDTCRYLRELESTEEAAYLLHYILRFAHLNNLKNIKKEVLEIFNTCERICEEKRKTKTFHGGKKILEELKSLASEE